MNLEDRVAGAIGKVVGLVKRKGIRRQVAQMLPGMASVNLDLIKDDNTAMYYLEIGEQMAYQDLGDDRTNYHKSMTYLNELKSNMSKSSERKSLVNDLNENQKVSLLGRLIGRKKRDVTEYKNPDLRSPIDKMSDEDFKHVFDFCFGMYGFHLEPEYSSQVPKRHLHEICWIEHLRRKYLAD